MNEGSAAFWAKTTQDGRPGISVRDHCLNVGCVAKVLHDSLPPAVRDLLPPEGAITLAALHDVGKISPGFQQKCPAWLLRNEHCFSPDNGNEPSHARVSQLFLEAWRAGWLRRWAEAIGAHHGRVQGDAPPGKIGGESWRKARLVCLESLELAFGKLPETDAPNDAAEWLLAGLTSVADWLGSDKENFSAKDDGPREKDAQQTKADEVVQRLELGGIAPLASRSFAEVFQTRLKGREPRPLQKALIDTRSLRPGIYVIEDTMGSGKTEAALWLAYRLMAAGQARGLYFGLPTRVTSDRIHRRVKEFLASVHPNGIEPPLVHGQAWLRDMPRIKAGWRGGGESKDEERPDEQVAAAQRWFASSRCGLLAPFAVGTVDQALLGVIAAKWFFVRQFALAGKVVVLYEVHSYDLYTGTLIARLVQRLRELKATPVILSATLTAAQRAKLLGENPPKRRGKTTYPLLTVKTGSAPAKHLTVEGAAKPKTVRIEPLIVPDFDSVESVVAHALQQANQGRCVLWIRNTVRQAQETYRMLNGEKCSGSFEVGLLHSRFPAFQRGGYPKLSLEELARRNLHEERWLWVLGKPEPPRVTARPKGCILVSTQVVEQSVDIDADVLLTDLAPTDMLLQRLGRLHRHEENGERGQPTCWLVVPQPLAQHARAMTTADIKAALGSVGHVYAPYVLLRTWERWGKAEVVTLPMNIRELLEGTYDERASKLRNEPKAWCELREELDREKSKLEALALNETNVRKPLREDEEGLGTRYSTQRQLPLLIMHWLSKEVDRAGNPAEIRLLNGSKLLRQDYLEFRLPAAKVLHLNVATIPAWWFPKALRAPLPPGLAQYFPDDTALALYDGEHSQLGLHGNLDSQAPVICYHPAEGLWLEKQPARAAIKPADDGEDDDGMF